MTNVQQIDQIHRLHGVTALTGLSRSTIYRLIALGQFPQPVKIGLRASGWRTSDLQAWVDSRASSTK